MAEICRWTNRSHRSMFHLRKMYDIKPDPKSEKILIDYGLSAYQYKQIEPLVIHKAKMNPSEKNIDLMILVFKKLGEPEKVVNVLLSQYKENPKNTMFLTKALELSLEMGDLELSKNIIKKLNKTKKYSKKDAALIARYYYLKRDIPKAYKSYLLPI